MKTQTTNEAPNKAGLKVYCVNKTIPNENSVLAQWSNHCETTHVFQHRTNHSPPS